jgi:hypothetical protein
MKKGKSVEGIGVGGVVVITGAKSAGKDAKKDAKIETITDTKASMPGNALKSPVG